ncbi:MAG: right-handed parallel beta-helix repeat-containing protein [Chloroflexota bacterium]
MDGRSFDRLTRLLAGRLTRRTGAGAALAGLAGLIGLPGAATPETGARPRRRDDGPAGHAPGEKHDVDDEKRPCGPKASDNRCRKHKDCCTKYCKKSKKGGKKSGRCRCIRAGKKCKDGQKCCGGATCQNRKCTPMPVPPPGPTCGAAGVACTEDANCCTGLICEQGPCAPCVETVCASGCAFTDVNLAYAAATSGATIYIGPGTYPTAFMATKDITLAACPGVTGVILQSARDATVQDTYGPDFAIIAEDTVDTTTPRSVTLRNLALEGTADGITNDDETFLSSTPIGLVAYTVEKCTLTNANYGIRTISNQHTVTDSVFDGMTNAGFYQGYPAAVRTSTADFTGCQFTNQDSYGIYIYMDTYDSTTTVTDCSFPGNGGYSIRVEGATSSVVPGRKLVLTNTTFTAGKLSGTSAYNYLRLIGASAEITGCTFTDGVDTAIQMNDSDAVITDTLIKDNTAESGVDGGGIFIDVSDRNSTLEIAGTTSITGNAATGKNGGGIYSYPYNGKTITITGTTTANVTSNLPNNCYLNGVGVVDCGTWA